MFSGRQWQAWAAVVAGIALLAAFLYQLNFRPTEQYSTAYGEIRNLTLPDGSEVILNANSTLTLATAWSEDHPREVELKGEAFFKIRKKKQGTRFIVRTNDLRVEVLGTQFNVSSRNRGTRVVLNTGKVKLNPSRNQPGESIFMVPGELAEVTQKQQRIVKKKVNPAHFSAWTNREWILDKTPLRDIATKLHDTFGLQATFATDDIAREQVTGRVSTEHLDELLDALSTINGLRMTRTGDKLYISR
jgi:ferric-dicitrate binding protein FerR (iron transport regulator)